MKKLNDLKIERSANIDKMNAIVNKAEAEKRGKNEAELNEWNSLDQSVRSIDNEIKILERQEELNKSNVIENNVIVEKNERKYDLFKAIREYSSNSLSGYELEVHKNAEKEFAQRGLSLNGLGITPEVRSNITAATGAATIKTDTSNYLSVVSEISLLDELGVTKYNNLVGNFKLPSMGALTASFVSEEGTTSEYASSLASVTLTPRRVGGTKKVTKEYLAQTSPELQIQLIDEFASAIERGITKEIFTQINTLTHISGFTSGDTKTGMTWANILKQEAELGTDSPNVKFVTAKKVMGALKGTAIDSGSGRMIWQDGQVNGYPAYSTSLISTNANSGYTMVLGDFSEVAVGYWGAMELLIDPYTSKNSGHIEITVNQLADVKVVNGNAFSVIANASA